MSVVIYDPTAHPARVEVPSFAGPGQGVAGQRVGLLDNGWPSWERLLGQFQQELEQQREAARVYRWDIPLSSAASDELINLAAESCDLTVVGLAN